MHGVQHAARCPTAASYFTSHICAADSVSPYNSITELRSLWSRSQAEASATDRPSPTSVGVVGPSISRPATAVGKGGSVDVSTQRHEGIGQPFGKFWRRQGTNAQREEPYPSRTARSPALDRQLSRRWPVGWGPSGLVEFEPVVDAVRLGSTRTGHRSAGQRSRPLIERKGAVRECDHGLE